MSNCRSIRSRAAKAERLMPWSSWSLRLWLLSAAMGKVKVSIHGEWAAMRLLACICSLSDAIPVFHVVGTHLEVDSTKTCQMHLLHLATKLTLSVSVAIEI
ncbi:hypothetical protein F5Y05DRAFT_149259 [Hypoxylon sp. FL0543]|nr:hypothetical protein F5Y05DRAFT_149259 [Hypoxylon sp. FL0543]